VEAVLEKLLGSLVILRKLPIVEQCFLLSLRILCLEIMNLFSDS